MQTHMDKSIRLVPMDHTVEEKETWPEYVELIVPQRHVKRVKTALEEHKLLNRKKGIVSCKPTTPSEPGTEPWMSISTTQAITVNDFVTSEITALLEATYERLFETLGLGNIKSEIKATSYSFPRNDFDPAHQGRSRPFVKIVKESFNTLPPDLLDSLDLSVGALIEHFSSSYTIYQPMLLLPRNNFTPCQTSTLSSPGFQPFWARIAARMGVTHIAINAPIPLQGATSDAVPTGVDGTPSENTLRSPINLTPIYGFFGPPPSPQTLESPTAADFDAALWVTHTQNGIHQTWAPLYTMFSRGNIREKTRVLRLPSVIASVAEPAGCTSVDLYAGIGYFVFPYRKAGVSKVLCWEMNPWSIRGLQKGAKMNGWRSQVINRGQAPSEAPSESADLIVFARSNEFALEDLAETKRAMDLPPVRHVNCGFLPTSNLSWKTAVYMIDGQLGGWIHAHENVGVSDIEERKVQVVTEITGHVKARGLRGEVRCEHVEKVKTYAPGVIHVVFDIWISATSSLAAS
ncbi:tRNA wybutosine-synthesizing protein 2 [Paraphaeosphaeria sporulosa]